MFFRQYELACLSLFSYMIGDATTGRAVVVDPQRDISRYLADAAAHGLIIERVIESHVHADFLSGHLELAAATGAVISYGSRATVGFPIDPLIDGQVLSLGGVVIEIRHTPGHTPEGISLVVSEATAAEPTMVLTGDTLFIGDVGRPDLLAASGVSADEMARDLYHSLHSRLLTLADTTQVYPAHGAGSACGKQMSAASSSTIGEQRATNYALAPMTIGDFVAIVTAGQPTTPPYFAHAAATNRVGHELLDEVAAIPTVAMNVAATGDAVLLDVRPVERFASGHLGGSINVGLDGRFAEYAGTVIRADRPIVLVGDSANVAEARMRLARIGFDTVIGAVADIERGLVEHPESAATAPRLTAADVVTWATEVSGVQIIDVRNPGETAVGGTIPDALCIPLSQLIARLGELQPHMPTIVYCAGGYRSSIAASTLRAHGFTQVADIVGGYGAWLAATQTPIR